jgi:hypothetical protein
LFNLEQLKNSENFRTKTHEKAIYKGEMIDHKRDGYGIMKYTSGRLYEGHWLDDLRDGEGFERYGNCNEYKGSFIKGR